MTTLNSPSGSGKRQSRNISHPLPRRSTRGPLDEADDPLSNPLQSPSTPTQSSETASEQHDDGQLPGPRVTDRPPLNVDLSFVKDPSNYHQLGTEDVPVAFLESANQPPLDNPLSDLLQHGHFRRAAGAAVIELVKCPADDATRIFELLYARLACLILLSRADLAAVEAASLIDFLARSAPGADEVTPWIPWELRILLVRLQSMAAADGGRSGIMAIYSLSAEARAHILDAKDAGNQAEVDLWLVRLSDLGLRVADTLVEMGELETATRHLDSLPEQDGDKVAYRKALLRLRIGNVHGAEQCLDDVTDGLRKSSLSALLAVANGELTQTMQKHQQLAESHSKDASFASNLAVGMLYAGKMSEARTILERLVTEQPTFPGLLFNISTIYELCTERAPDRKAELANMLAAKAPSTASGGWERANFEIKL